MIIETRALSKQYRGVEAVRGLDLVVPEGRISGFLGANGSGKSTTIKMLLGMVRPTSGEGFVFGKPIDEDVASLEIRKRVGFAGEDKRLYGYMTVAQILNFTRPFFPHWRRDREEKLLNDFRLPLERKIKALSKGMRTKLALVLAIARGAELLILDEPSEGLDPVATEVMLKAVTQAAADGATIFFSSHQIPEIERIADHIFVIHNGRLVLEGALAELQQNYRRVNVVFPGRAPLAEMAFASIRKVRCDGHVLSMLANGDLEAIAQRARALGAISIDDHPVNLRELFLESLEQEEPS